eukprot:CAMPEP_0198561190 /NCGR_PEP_ID=MMETSP1462-20131121/95041_1 /TAXON_ID=1333877 /ORGANISM="Brandtodinium nutriculum, Strain RCC3387" /LENGTH=31 /DNA_ID= /DNA_START= /DNA_END= /DNA_ORIENTATION=
MWLIFASRGLYDVPAKNVNVRRSASSPVGVA